MLKTIFVFNHCVASDVAAQSIILVFKQIITKKIVF